MSQEDWPHYAKDWSDSLFQARVQGVYDWIGSGPDRLTTVEFTQQEINMYQLSTANRDIDIFPPRDEIDPDLQFFPEPKDWEDRKNLILHMSSSVEPELGYFEDELDEDAGPDTYYLMGNIYFLQQNYTSAIEHYRRAIEEFSRFRLAYKNMAYAYVSLGDCPNALPAAQKATELGAFSAQLKGLVAYCSILQGNHHSALEAAAIARILDDDNLSWLQLEIEALIRLGRYHHAESLVEKHFNEPGSIEKRIAYLTEIYRGDNNSSALLSMLEIKSRFHSITQQEILELTQLKIAIGLANLVDNKELTEFIVESAPSYAELTTIISSQLGVGDFQSAIEINNVLDQSNIVLSPVEKSSLSVTQARVLRESGLPEAAIEGLERVLLNSPLHCEALLQSAEILSSLDQIDLANAYLVRADNSSTQCSNEALGRKAKIFFDQGDYLQSYELYLRDSRQKSIDGISESQWRSDMLQALSDLVKLEL